MSTRRYDEQDILRRVAALDRGARTAFAAACAERLRPLFERFAVSVGRPDQIAVLSSLLAGCWAAAAGEGQVTRADRRRAEALVPMADHVWTVEVGYGENAAAAVAYAVGTWLDDSAQDAVWAARQLYEMADLMTLHVDPAVTLNAPGVEDRILLSEVVQRSLHEIDRSLAQVEAAPAWWRDVRDAAASDGASWADRAP